MSADPSGAVAGRGLPAATNFRFALLAVGVTASSVFVYQGLYLASPRGAVWQARAASCLSQAIRRTSGMSNEFGIALHQAASCRSGTDLSEALWSLMGVAVLLVVAILVYLAQPWLLLRRQKLRPLSGDQSPALAAQLDALRARAGVGPVTWLLQPRNGNVSAFTFGRVGRRCVAVSGGAAVAAIRQPGTFNAIVLHELGHIRNRDIDQTYLAVAIWRAFVVTALLPMAVLLVVSRELGSPVAVLWRTILLALVVYLLRNWVLRSREFDADARVLTFDPGSWLGEVLATAPRDIGGRWRALTRVHPPSWQRAVALHDHTRIAQAGFWDGIALGLVAGLGASCATDIGFLFTATNLPLGTFIATVIFAPFIAAALVATVWRATAATRGTGHGTWAVGIGLGAGVALGPIVALPTGLLPGIAPDTLTWPTVAVLAAWLALGIALFASLPPWISLWAAAWQWRARPGLPIVVAGSAVALAIGMDLMLECFAFVQSLATDPAIRNQLGQVWMYFFPDIALQAGAWLVCAAVLAVPALAWATRQRYRPAGYRPAGYRPAVRTIALAIAAAVATVLLVLAISATAHYGVAQPVRWNVYFFTRLVHFDQQAVLAVAAGVAVVVAASRPPQLAGLAVAAAAAVGAAGVIAVDNIGAAGSCAATFNIAYTNPPAGRCPLLPSAAFIGGQVHQEAIGAALVAILIVPAAVSVGRWIACSRAAGWTRTVFRAPGVRPTWWGAGGAVAVATAAGLCWWAVSASGHGVKPIGSIGQDGWLRGTGYELRLVPYWYSQAGAPPGQFHLAASYGSATLYLVSDPTTSKQAGVMDAKLIKLGARWVRIGGTPGLRYQSRDPLGDQQDIWVISQGDVQYTALFVASPDVAAVAGEDANTMLNSWRWES